MSPEAVGSFSASAPGADCYGLHTGKSGEVSPLECVAAPGIRRILRACPGIVFAASHQTESEPPEDPGLTRQCAANPQGRGVSISGSVLSAPNRCQGVMRNAGFDSRKAQAGTTNSLGERRSAEQLGTLSQPLGSLRSLSADVRESVIPCMTDIGTHCKCDTAQRVARRPRPRNHRNRPPKLDRKSRRVSPRLREYHSRAAATRISPRGPRPGRRKLS